MLSEFSMQHFNENSFIVWAIGNWKWKQEEEENKIWLHSLSDNSKFDSVKNKITSLKSWSVLSLFVPLNFHSFCFHSILCFHSSSTFSVHNQNLITASIRDFVFFFPFNPFLSPFGLLDCGFLNTFVT